MTEKDVPRPYTLLDIHFSKSFFFIFQKTEFLMFPPYQIEEYSFVFRDQYKIKKRLVYYMNEIFKTSI